MSERCPICGEVCIDLSGIGLECPNHEEHELEIDSVELKLHEELFGEDSDLLLDEDGNEIEIKYCDNCLKIKEYDGYIKSWICPECDGIN